MMSVSWRIAKSAAVAVVLMTAALSGCGMPGPSPKLRGPCIVEIDVTSSIRHAGLVRPSWLQPFIAQIARGCPAQAVDASLVTANSQADECARITLGPVSLDGNSTHDEAAEASRHTDLTKDVSGLLACGLAHPRRANKTDLFGAFTDAGLVAAGRSGTRLYVLSDMVEDKGRWDFYRRRFDDAHNRRMLAQLRDAHLIPAGLSGAAVTVIGTAAGALKMTPESLAGMKRFWRLYFKASGTTLNIEVGESR